MQMGLVQKRAPTQNLLSQQPNKSENKNLYVQISQCISLYCIFLKIQEWLITAGQLSPRGYILQRFYFSEHLKW